ncbi:uncharacterized protein A1O5_07914 [Cladophialophora psammophila CBS 110553]|uniref:Major facilitator superfamily (MFS) profile domain-containing protein n=1 Tax=Cladophialophora psammophila CBS 110553 TaxID=1182543 RepID=W9XF30_9EURO|nr:uncharacterized protein A1O5_07914 [Cladophialophora psammophila CBS 110553]EXJ68979.1 hypothetical protein A1O5_07914 [Cladophialophora psammophila CBS 110553]
MISPKETSQEEKQVGYYGDIGAKSHVTAHEGHHLTTEEVTQEGEGILLTISTKDGTDTTGLKLAPDGRTVLIPQPSDDPNDPLNCPWWKKHAVLLTTSILAGNGDFSLCLGFPAVLPQALHWDKSYNSMNFTTNLAVIMVGVGGVLAIPPSYFWGRAPVVFWAVLASVFFTLGICLTDNFEAFYALRALQGATLTVCQTTALCYIKDMFFLHEHARKIGIWLFFFYVTPYIGPMLGYFMISGLDSQWRPLYWLALASTCFDLVLVVLFLDETWYRRDVPLEEQPPRGSRWQRVIGIWQIRLHRGYFVGALPAFGRFWAVLIKPLMLPILVYFCLYFMWATGVNITAAVLLGTPEDVGGYGFSPKASGFIYFAPAIGVTLGEALGHWLNDWNAARYTRRHDGLFKAEARLPVTYLGTIIMTFKHHLHWLGIAFGWGIYIFGAMLSSVAITTYALECYPQASGEVSAFINFMRVMGGFAVGYFQQPWGVSVGYGASFGTQAAVIVAAGGILIFIYFYEERLRVKGRPLRFPGST